MRRLIVLLLAAGCATDRSEPPPVGAPALAVTHVTVVDATGAAPRTDQTVVVADGRIAAIGPTATTRVPAGAEVIDAGGQYLIPGLWDMHVHTLREGRAPRFFPLFLAHGVTGVREMGTFLDSLDHWRGRIADGMLAPRIVAAGHVVDAPPPGGGVVPAGQPTPAWAFALSAATPDEARAAVDTIAARRVDFVKPYSGLSREAYFALAERARARGVPLAGHLPTAVRPMEAVEAGQRTMEHLLGILEVCVPDWDARLAALGALARRADAGTDAGRAAMRTATRALLGAYDPATCAPLHARFRADSVYQVPTLVQLRGLGRRQERSARDDPRLRYVPAEIRARWEPRANADSAELRDVHDASVRIVADMHRRGVPILAGTDASDEAYVFPGSALHEELETFVRAGMTPMAALQTATRDAARAVGLAAVAGTIEVGKRADLVLLDADPMADIRHTARIRAVVLDGRLLRRAALDSLLTQAEALARRP